MIKKLIKKLLKKKVTEEVTLLDKISEVIQIAMDYKHTNQLDDYISVEYSGWANDLRIWMWDERTCLLNVCIDLGSDDVMEQLEKIRIKLLKLIEIVKVKKED
jgi:hypothetical protein